MDLKNVWLLAPVHWALCMTSTHINHCTVGGELDFSWVVSMSQMCLPYPQSTTLLSDLVDKDKNWKNTSWTFWDNSVNWSDGRNDYTLPGLFTHYGNNLTCQISDYNFCNSLNNREFDSDSYEKWLQLVRLMAHISLCKGWAHMPAFPQQGVKSSHKFLDSCKVDCP